MKVIYNSVIPFKSFIAINLFGILFVRKDTPLSVVAKIKGHEEIHTAQMKEMLYVFFYLWYIFEWLVRFIYIIIKERACTREIAHAAYRAISFEREARFYEKVYTSGYLIDRVPFTWTAFI